MTVLRCSATVPQARPGLRRSRKAVPNISSRQLVVSVTASLSDNHLPSENDGPARPTLHGKLGYIAVGAAILTIAPACVPILASGGGGGGYSFFQGFGGGGGGGFFNSIVPVALAADDDEDDDDEDGDETDDTDEDDDDDDEDDDDEDDDEDEEDGEEEGVASRSIVTRDADSNEGDSDIDDDDVAEELKYMKPPDGMDRSSFFCVDVQADGLPVGRGCPTPKELFASLNCQPGFWVSKSKLDQDLSDLRDMGIFKEVEVKIVPLKKGSKSKRMRAIFTFSETFFPPIKSFTILNSKVLPSDMSERVMNAIKKFHEGQPTGLAVLTTVRNELENWYMDRGFAYCQLGSFEGLDTGNISLTVSEPKIRNVIVRYVDENFQEKDDGGNTPVDLVLRTVSLRPGQYYSQFDGRKALQEAFTLQVFENAQVIPEFIQGVDDQMDVALLLKERAVKTMDLDMEWALSPVIPRLPLPLPMTVVPGGSITYEDRNFADCGDHVSASLMCSNFLHPTDDLSAHVQYRRPFVFGRATDEDLVVHAFNARRLSTVFTSSSGGDSVPPVWVERAGAKVGLARHLSRHSNSNLGVVAQQIKTRDDTNSLVTHGAVGGKQRGDVDSSSGPPTTLSGSGIDRTVTLQGSAVRDTTFTINGAIIGSRDVGEVDQGIGLGSGIFNKYTMSLTRFLKLNTPSSSSVLAPFVLALHAKHGNCLGPLASYDYHVLGGPHSCRGYSLGELGPARSFLETCVELRAPVPLLRTHAFLFAENARDLGSAGDLAGRPREVYNRPGQGSAVGAGIKLGIMRLEWARDCNVGKGTWFVNFGERF